MRGNVKASFCFVVDHAVPPGMKAREELFSWDAVVTELFGGVRRITMGADSEKRRLSRLYLSPNCTQRASTGDCRLPTGAEFQLSRSGRARLLVNGELTIVNSNPRLEAAGRARTRTQQRPHAKINEHQALAQ